MKTFVILTWIIILIHFGGQYYLSHSIPKYLLLECKVIYVGDLKNAYKQYGGRYIIKECNNGKRYNVDDGIHIVGDQVIHKIFLGREFKF